MIAALLHGRTHLNFQEFRQQNHLTFFMHVLGVLELLQPQVFQSEHQGALWDCLLSFVRLLRVGAPSLCPAPLCPHLQAPSHPHHHAPPPHSEFSPQSVCPPVPTTAAGSVLLTRTGGLSTEAAG